MDLRPSFVSGTLWHHVGGLDRWKSATLIHFWQFCPYVRSFQCSDTATLTHFRHLLTSCWKLGMFRKCSPHTFSAPRKAQELPGALRSAESLSRRSMESGRIPRTAEETPGAPKVHFLFKDDILHHGPGVPSFELSEKQSSAPARPTADVNRNSFATRRAPFASPC